MNHFSCFKSLCAVVAVSRSVVAVCHAVVTVIVVMFAVGMVVMPSSAEAAFEWKGDVFKSFIGEFTGSSKVFTKKSQVQYQDVSDGDGAGVEVDLGAGGYVSADGSRLKDISHGYFCEKWDEGCQSTHSVFQSSCGLYDVGCLPSWFITFFVRGNYEADDGPVEGDSYGCKYDDCAYSE